MTVGVVSAGAMGSAIGAALARGGERVVTTLAGRSERTARLADRAGLELLPDLARSFAPRTVVLSIVPPEAAGTVVAAIADSAEREGVSPIVADLNAVAPATARVAAGGCRTSGLRTRGRLDLGPAAVESGHDADLPLGRARRRGCGSPVRRRGHDRRRRPTSDRRPR